jgi:serine phosphatase RsbU (regulator of sigma subunit)
MNDAEQQRTDPPPLLPSPGSLTPEPDTRSYRNRSAMCVPLTSKGEILGVLNINDRRDHKEFTATDLFVAKVIANQAAVAIANARLVQVSADAASTRRALDVARSIQQSFIPQPPDVPGILVAGRSDACDETGGDYIDYAPSVERDGTPTGRLLIAIGDVSGHGVGSALIMATSRAFLRALLESTRDLKTLIERLNRLVCNDVRDGQFMTLFAGTIDPAKGTLTYASAGHDPPILYRPSTDELFEFDSTGVPLGVMDDFDFGVETVDVKPGDVLVLSTDGVWECNNAREEAFGRERFVASIRRHHTLPPAEMIDALKRDVVEFCQPVPFHDDFSLVVATLVPLPDAAAADSPEFETEPSMP